MKNNRILKREPFFEKTNHTYPYNPSSHVYGNVSFKVSNTLSSLHSFIHNSVKVSAYSSVNSSSYISKLKN